MPPMRPFIFCFIMLYLSIHCFACVSAFHLLISTTHKHSHGSSLKSQRLDNLVGLMSSDVTAIIPYIETYEDIDVKASESSSDDDSAELDTAKLVQDIDKLTEILGGIIKRENKEVYELYTEFRGHALSRSKGDKKSLSKMLLLGSKISPENGLGVARAFTQTLNLINAAEVHHRMRRLRIADSLANRASPLPFREDSVAGAIANLLAPSGEKLSLGDSGRTFIMDGSVEQKKTLIFEALLKQKVDIVITAHPTEVNRRTLLRKYRSISEILASLDRQDFTAFERVQALESLRREVGSIWVN